MVFNETLLEQTKNFPYENPEAYVTIESCRAACDGLTLRLTTIHWGLLALVILLTLVIVIMWYTYTKTKKE